MINGVSNRTHGATYLCQVLQAACLEEPHGVERGAGHLCSVVSATEWWALKGRATLDGLFWRACIGTAQ